jgi:hypothetical protein
MRVSANRRVRRSQAEWRTLCERFTRSGLEVAEFCSREKRKRSMSAHTSSHILRARSVSCMA